MLTHNLQPFITLLFITTVLAAHTYNKVVLDDPKALCLDGTKGAYYIHVGTQATKFLLSFEGGGWCGSSAGLSQTLDGCYYRSNGALGSSSSYQPVITASLGVLGDGPENHFKDWTKVEFKYCDGTGHQGFKEEPVVYKGKSLYFRGHSVTIGQLNSVDSKHKLFSAAT